MTMATTREASILYNEVSQAYYDHFGYWLDTYAPEVFNIASPNDTITPKSAKAFKKMVDEAIEKNEPIEVTPTLLGQTIE